METVGAYEAKTHLPKLLDRVAKGEQIIITRHGSPVAIMQPADRSKQVDVAAVIRKMRSLRKAHQLGGLSVKDMIEEGRK
jgi:prevent-host-death family protein